MGRAGRSGGGRSSGSSRHSSSSHSSSRSHHSSMNHSSVSHTSRGFDHDRGMGHHNPPPPPRHHYHRPWRNTSYYSSGPVYTSGFDGFSIIIKIIIIAFLGIGLLSIIGKLSSGSSSNKITNSKIWSSGYKTSKNDYYEDHLEMQLDKTTEFTKNMQTFKTKTGLKPFVFTCERINGSSVPSDADFDELAEYIYTKNKLTDTVLLIYQESDDNWGCWVYMDDSVTEREFSDEAIDRLIDFIENNYDSSYTNGQLFSKAFLYAVNERY